MENRFNLDRIIKWLFTFAVIKIAISVVACFTYFSTPHHWRQADTMGVTLRYWLRWTVEPELQHPFLPAVLTAGDAYGIAPMEFPILNILLAPLFFFDLEWGRTLTRLVLLLINISLLWISYRVWHQHLGVQIAKLSHLFLVLNGLSFLYIDKFMPDFTSFILVLVAMGYSWDKPSIKSFLPAALGLLIKPTSIIVFLLFLRRPFKELLRDFSGYAVWGIPAVGLALFYYTYGLDFIRSHSDIEETVYLKMGAPWLNLGDYFKDPHYFMALLRNGLFSVGTLFLILINALMFKFHGQKMLFVILIFQCLMGIMLGGIAVTYHEYYLIGASFTVALILSEFVRSGNKYLVALVLIILCSNVFTRGYYSMRNFVRSHHWATCTEIRKQIPSEIYKVGSEKAIVAHTGVCVGKIQNSDESPYFIGIDSTGNYVLKKR